MEPGWKIVQARPVPRAGLTSAQQSSSMALWFKSCDRQTDNKDRFETTLIMPPDSQAAVTLPNGVGTRQGLWAPTITFPCDCDVGEWPPVKCIPPFLQKATEGTMADELWAEVRHLHLSNVVPHKAQLHLTFYVTNE